MLNSKLNLSTNTLGEDIKKEATRAGFGRGLIKAGEINSDVVVLSADLAESVRIKDFSEKFPERFFESGVAEQGMITVASGLANYGKIPFAVTYACFSPGRNWEQIKTTIAVNNFPVKIVGGHAGVNTGQDGVTHQSIEDIALLRTLPNMTIISPVDAEEMEKAVIKSIDIDGPVYLRMQKHESPVFTTSDTPFEIGKANVLWEGKNAQVTIIGHGPIVYEVLLAAKELEEHGIGVVVINMHTIKPLDEETVLKYAMNTKAIVTAEDHQIIGGLGSAVSEYLSSSYPIPMEFVGVKDQFGESGKPDELLEKFELKSKHIVKAVKKVILRKDK